MISALDCQDRAWLGGPSLDPAWLDPVLRAERCGCSAQALLQLVESVVQMSAQTVDLGP
jgi:hypothetical protein